MHNNPLLTEQLVMLSEIPSFKGDPPLNFMSAVCHNIPVFFSRVEIKAKEKHKRLSDFVLLACSQVNTAEANMVLNL